MPCIDAMTPSAPNRGMSDGAEVLRVFDAPAQILLVGVGLECRFVDVQRFPVGAIADGMHAELVAVVLERERGGLRNARRLSVVLRPVLSGLSLYGSSSHAPRDPSAPSIDRLIARTVR